MIKVPDPLPKDVAELQKIAQELIRENQEHRRRLDRMENLVEILEDLAKLKEESE